MTEEQKKKCEEIYNLHIDFPLKIRPIFLPKFGWVKIAMLLAEVFNKNISEEEAKEIFNNAWELNTNLCEDNYDNFWNDICNEIKKLNK